MKNIFILGTIMLILPNISACQLPLGPSDTPIAGAYYAKTPVGKQAVVIYEDYLSWYFYDKRLGDLRYNIYRFSSIDDAYASKNIRSNIKFKIKGNNLTIQSLNDEGKVNNTFKLKQDTSVGLSNEDPIQLVPPEYNEGWNGNISWRPEIVPKGDNGIMGILCEVKPGGMVDFQFFCLMDWIGAPQDHYGPSSYAIKLAQGTYVFRYKYLGGPFVNNANKIQLSLDSEYLYFNQTVDTWGYPISFEEIIDYE